MRNTVSGGCNGWMWLKEGVAGDGWSAACCWLSLTLIWARWAVAHSGPNSSLAHTPASLSTPEREGCSVPRRRVWWRLKRQGAAARRVPMKTFCCCWAPRKKDQVSDWMSACLLPQQLMHHSTYCRRCLPNCFLWMSRYKARSCKIRYLTHFH